MRKRINVFYTFVLLLNIYDIVAFVRLLRHPTEELPTTGAYAAAVIALILWVSCMFFLKHMTEKQRSVYSFMTICNVCAVVSWGFTFMVSGSGILAQILYAFFRSAQYCMCAVAPAASVLLYTSYGAKLGHTPLMAALILFASVIAMLRLHSVSAQFTEDDI